MWIVHLLSGRLSILRRTITYFALWSVVHGHYSPGRPNWIALYLFRLSATRTTEGVLRARETLAGKECIWCCCSRVVQILLNSVQG